MIKFIYHVEASEEAVNPIGFSFFDIEHKCLVMFNCEQIWESIDGLTADIECEEEMYDINLGKDFYLDLIPKGWNKVKFKQV